MRDLDPPERDFIRDAGIHTGKHAVDRALHEVDCVYVALDFDGLDEADVSSFMPVPGGIRLDEAVETFRRLAAEKTVLGAGFTGLVPDERNLEPATRLAVGARPLRPQTRGRYPYRRLDRAQGSARRAPTTLASIRTRAPRAGRTTATTSSTSTSASARSAATTSRSRRRERIGLLADPGTFSEEETELRSADPLDFFDLRPYTERLAEAELKTGQGDAILIGRAEIEGEQCQLSVMDFGFMGGSMGSVVGEKFARACEAAAERRVPLVSVTASGGARMQEGILSLMQMPKTVCAVEDLHDARCALINVFTHPTTAGVLASFASLGDVTVAEPGALISFTGPRVVQGTTREKLPDDFGLAESNLRFGHVDAIVQRRDLRPHVGRLLRLFGNAG